MSYKIKSKLWIEHNGEIVMGEGRFRLLKALEYEGSLSSAARSVGISYKKAWKLLDSVNKNAKETVYSTTRGGSGGGGAELTDYGKRLLVQFESIRKDCWQHLNEGEEKLKAL